MYGDVQVALDEAEAYPVHLHEHPVRVEVEAFAGILYPAAEDGGDEAQEELVTDAVFRGFLCFSFFFQKNSCIFVAS